MSRIDLLPGAGPVLTLRQALYRAGRDYHGGITRLAFDMGLEVDTLQKKLHHNEERRWPTPDELEEIVQLTADPRLLDALVRPAGVVWYRPEPVPATNDALQAVAKLLEESGQFVGSLHDGASDKIWTLAEVLDLEQRGLDVIRQVLAITAGAREAMEDINHG
ncbi:phage regulatory CII family protein [Pseudomonas sp. MWU13-3659]|uniref:phage regulatory CII family protein n=1 Tax=Pseudomonas sp. MWU13-3659 TaxID=2986964 RepID=UPI0020751F8E|nr:phage regulatory CII family protein [Pseudomonas sp. MWU13-3659]